ncbi:MAG: hypothetical protein KUG78_06115 [Kangiellaceae bacterium]|nr:hypothetical protein [Kangiellaceae bacterium]
MVHLLASSRKVPRTGGIIFVKAESKQQVDKIIAQDLIYIAKLAEYEIVQFEPSMMTPELALQKDL